MKRFGLISLFIVLLATTAHGVEDSMLLKTGKVAYWRYELVDVQLSLMENSGLTAGLLPKTINVTIWKNKKMIKTVGKMDKLPLQYDGNGYWKGKWPIPFEPRLGKYLIKTSVYAKGSTQTAQTTFTIKGRKPYEMKPGFSVVTYEGGKKGPGKTPGLNVDEKPSWKNMVRWADQMGADAFWQCVGQTQVWGKIKEEQFPWSEGTLRLMPRVGKQVKEAGFEYGAWITAFVAIGNKIEKTGYQFTYGFNRKKNALKELRYISLGCQKRLDHIVELMKKLNETEAVDYIGLDYMRTDFGGYEFATEFVDDMAITRPEKWERWSPNERSLWLANLIEIKRDQSTRQKWEWWRAHKVGLTIEYLMEQVKPTKPVWVFSLGWKTGHQHGQDMLMMLDAGIGFNAPMFYSISRQDYPHMLSSWRNYLNKGECGVVIGQCVDWNLLGRTTDPAGTAEHLIRQEKAIEKLMKPAKHFGLFWHDLNRAFFGARGPFGTTEWMMAGAASFTKVKAASKRYPFTVSVEKPVEIIKNRSTQLPVTIVNHTGNSLTALSVSLVDTPRLIKLRTEPVIIKALAPNEKKLVSLGFKVESIFERNGGQQMVAVKIEQLSDLRNPYYDMIYLPITKELGPMDAVSNTPDAFK